MEGINKKLILFVCTVNASRSQIARGWADFLFGEDLIAFSAGIMPTLKLNESAVASMARVGIDISDQYTKSVDELCGLDFDFIVTLSDEAREYFANYKGGGKLVHFDVAATSDVIGDAAQIKIAADNYRDSIRDIVKEVATIALSSNNL